MARRKRYLCHRIIERFPSHHTYVEPFGGAASVLLNKPPVPVEIYNDLDGRITRLFEVIRNHGDEFRWLSTMTPYSEAEFREAQNESENVINRPDETSCDGECRLGAGEIPLVSLCTESGAEWPTLCPVISQ